MRTEKKRIFFMTMLWVISICFALTLTACSRVHLQTGGDDPENTEEGRSPEPEETENHESEPHESPESYSLQVEFFLDRDLPWDEGESTNAFRVFKVAGDQEVLVYTFDKAEYLGCEKLKEDYTVIEGFSDLEGSLVFYFEDTVFGDHSILVIGEENGRFIEKYYGFAYDYILKDVDGDGSTEIMNSISNGGGYVSWWMGFYTANTAGADGYYEPSYDMTRKYYKGLKKEAEAQFEADRNTDTFQSLIDANVFLGDYIVVEDLLLKYDDIADEVNKEFRLSDEGAAFFSYSEFSVYQASCYNSLWDEVFQDDLGSDQNSSEAFGAGSGLSEDQYLEYFSSIHEDEAVEYCLIEDLDMDGFEEAVVVVSNDFDEIEGFYILRNRNGRMEQVDDKAGDESGYGIDFVELVRMDGMNQTCIYVEVTNGASLYGFSLYELKDGEIQLLCISASATGAGEDALYDTDDDGLFDGYYQNRWSYDVLYYSVYRTYPWSDGTFVPGTCSIDLPEYPESIEETVIEYLALNILDLDNCPEADERLTRLYPGNSTAEPDFIQYALRDAVFNEIIGLDEGQNLDVSQDGDIAEAVLSYQDSDGTRCEYTFHLVHENYGWSIDSID